MVESNKAQKTISTCMENIPFAEMMQKTAGKKGIGSLCADMMKQVMEKKGEDCGARCTEMMQSMMKECCGVKQDTPKTKEEAGHDRDK